MANFFRFQSLSCLQCDNFPVHTGNVKVIPISTSLVEIQTTNKGPPLHYNLIWGVQIAESITTLISGPGHISRYFNSDGFIRNDEDDLPLTLSTGHVGQCMSVMGYNVGGLASLIVNSWLQ